MRSEAEPSVFFYTEEKIVSGDWNIEEENPVYEVPKEIYTELVRKFSHENSII